MILATDKKSKTNDDLNYNYNPTVKFKLKFKCGFCGKQYVRHSLFERHFKSCKTKDELKKKRKPNIQSESEHVTILSLNRKLNHVLDLLYVQSERMKHMEKMLESKTPVIKNKLQWLIKNAVPSKTYDECLSSIKLNKTHYDYIAKHGYLKGYCDLAEEIIDKYKESIYSFTTSSVTYVYVNSKEKWIEFNKSHSYMLYQRIQQQLLGIALTVKDIPDRILLTTNAIIYGIQNQSIDIKTKIKSLIYTKTIVGVETLLNRYEVNK